MLLIFHFGKELALSLFHGFCSPKITTPPPLPQEERPPAIEIKVPNHHIMETVTST